MIRLPEGGSPLRSILPAGRDAVAWHAALSAEIGAGLSAVHAALLARPQREGNGLGWFADGEKATRYGDLPEPARRQLDAALGAILSDIRRLAESGAAPVLRAVWPSLREVPDMGHVFAVDGRPVLVGWGHLAEDDPVGASARLARLDDGVAWRAAPGKPWGLYAATLAVLALLGLVGGLALPQLGSWFAPAPARCAIVPGQLEAMRRQAAEDSRGAQLRTLLATLTEEVGRKQLQCPVPAAPSRPPAAPLPAPQAAPPQTPPPPAPRAELPQDRWNERDLSLLEGCWTLTTGMTVTSEGTGRMSPVSSWRQCFDAQGAGRQTVAVQDGRRCEGRLSATFEPDGQLLISEPEPCRGTLTLSQSVRTCRRTSDTEAMCEGHAVSGPRAGVLYHGLFRR